MKDQHGDGLAYAGTEGTVAVYEMWLGDRVVFRVHVDEADPHLRVKIRRPEPDAPELETPYQAMMDLFFYKTGPEVADVQCREHVHPLSVQAIVYARFPWMMADLYVPGRRKVEVG